jgi:uncharacterized protein (DUF934 family)
MRGDTHIAAALVIERGGADEAPANDTGAVEIPGETPVGEALALSEGTRAVDIRFAKFSDGRGFSLAAILRERGYTGSIRAVGQIIPDQAGLLARAGFDSVKPDAEGPQGRWALAHPGSGTAYQPGPAASAPSAFLRRAAAARKNQVERLNAECSKAGSPCCPPSGPRPRWGWPCWRAARRTCRCCSSTRSAISPRP